MIDRARLVEKYETEKMDRPTMGMRIAKESKDGDCVNLGRGIHGWTPEEVQPVTDARLKIAPDVKVVER